MILASSVLREIVWSSGEIEFGEPREIQLKGLAGEHRLFPVAWN